ncbi:hypothetical protein MHM83_10895 [Tenacibaculum sp. Mcav3-52]|uniref:hypothetical protein n=1 Tax=Tenacibaculum sp. Mcav3-52 TaxID=2917762 RepID=UPI001EF33F24|nr:hypothetical protein [Tenacibaculum sp. Mcav3-52]MCG7502379.1 hypothetical protein [Tenacibaculum sp. Mcav3-52]
MAGLIMKDNVIHRLRFIVPERHQAEEVSVGGYPFTFDSTKVTFDSTVKTFDEQYE